MDEESEEEMNDPTITSEEVKLEEVEKKFFKKKSA